MKYFICLILSAFMLISCQDVKRSSRPSDLIAPDKMVDVLTDLALLQGARSYNKTMLEETGIKPAEYLWERHDIDSLQFVRSNDYYAENYRTYQEIYNRVKLRLENYKEKYDSLRVIEEKRLDSLREEGIDLRDTILKKDPDPVRGRRELPPLPDTTAMGREGFLTEPIEQNPF